MDRERVDVVIPVYNAPELTRRCIDSLYEYVEPGIGRVIAYDDASDAPTARMLDALAHPRLAVVHGDPNVGFGAAVNRGVERCTSPLVLVLNSDVEARDDFLSPLVQVLRSDPRAAAVSPGGESFRRYDFDRYVKRSGCVVTHHLPGHAFLVRRDLFREVGGFDPLFGRGFFEDRDLSRRLYRAGWWIGVHPRCRLDHASHGSFGELDGFRELVEENRQKYYGRYPDAATRVLLLTSRADATDLPPSLRHAVDGVLQAGGEVHWLAPEPPVRLPALGMRPVQPAGLRRGVGLLARRARRYKRFTGVWILDDSPRVASSLLRLQSRMFRIPIREWTDDRAGPGVTSPQQDTRL